MFVKDSRLSVDYCFKNENAQCGYVRGNVTYPRNPNKTLGSELERLLKAAEEKEKQTIIFIGYVLY